MAQSMHTVETIDWNALLSVTLNPSPEQQQGSETQEK